MDRIICPINTSMHASNVQLKATWRPPLYCEPCEANGAVKACMQEAPALWIKASMSEANAQSKDTSQACIETGQKSNQRMWIEGNFFSLQFCQKDYFYLFSPFLTYSSLTWCWKIQLYLCKLEFKNPYEKCLEKWEGKFWGTTHPYRTLSLGIQVRHQHLTALNPFFWIIHYTCLS